MPQAKKKKLPGALPARRVTKPTKDEMAYRQEKLLAQRPSTTRAYKPRHTVHNLTPGKREPYKATCTVRRCGYAVWLAEDGSIKARCGEGPLEPSNLFIAVSLWG